MKANSIIENSPIATWTYSNEDWNMFVSLEKANKKEDNIYFGIGIVILGTIGLMILRNTSFLTGLLFSVPLAFLIPFLRMKFSYPHLKTHVKNPIVKIFSDKLIINKKTIELTSKRKRVKSIKILVQNNGSHFLEFDVQWLTAKGPTNDEFRILIPEDKMEEANNLLSLFYS